MRYLGKDRLWKVIVGCQSECIGDKGEVRVDKKVEKHKILKYIVVS